MINYLNYWVCLKALKMFSLERCGRYHIIFTETILEGQVQILHSKITYWREQYGGKCKRSGEE